MLMGKRYIIVAGCFISIAHNGKSIADGGTTKKLISNNKQNLIL